VCSVLLARCWRGGTTPVARPVPPGLTIAVALAGGRLSRIVLRRAGSFSDGATTARSYHPAHQHAAASAWRPVPRTISPSPSAAALGGVGGRMITANAPCRPRRHLRSRVGGGRCHKPRLLVRTVVGWGDIRSANFHPARPHRVARISAGRNHSLALRTNVTWPPGVHPLRTNDNPPSARPMRAIAAVTSHCRMRADCTVVAVGYNNFKASATAIRPDAMFVSNAPRAIFHTYARRAYGTVGGLGDTWYLTLNIPSLSTNATPSPHAFHGLSLLPPRSSGVCLKAVAWFSDVSSCVLPVCSHSAVPFLDINGACGIYHP